jgi:hypothetical protein
LNIVFTTSLKLGGNGAPGKDEKPTGNEFHNNQMKGPVLSKI